MKSNGDRKGLNLIVDLRHSESQTWYCFCVLNFSFSTAVVSWNLFYHSDTRTFYELEKSTILTSRLKDGQVQKTFLIELLVYSVSSPYTKHWANIHHEIPPADVAAVVTGVTCWRESWPGWREASPTTTVRTPTPPSSPRWTTAWSPSSTMYPRR